MNFERGGFEHKREKDAAERKIDGVGKDSREKLQAALRAAVLAATALMSNADNVHAQKENLPPIMVPSGDPATRTPDKFGNVFSGDRALRLVEVARQIQMDIKHASLALDDAMDEAQKLSAKDAEKFKDVVLNLALNKSAVESAAADFQESMSVSIFSGTIQRETVPTMAAEKAFEVRLVEALHALEDVQTGMRMQLMLVDAQDDDNDKKKTISDKIKNASTSLEKIQKSLAPLSEEVKIKAAEKFRIIEPRKRK